MQNNSLEKLVLEKIKQDNIKVRSSWYFVSVKYFLYFLIVSLIFISGVALSLVEYAFFDPDDGLIYMNFIEDIIVSIPLIWMFTIVFSMLLIKYLVHKLPNGYKYTFKQTASFVIGFSLFIGVLFSIINVGEDVYRYLDEVLNLSAVPFL